MKLAYTMAQTKGSTDLLLLRLSETLAAQGFAACGTVQINTECASGPCDMDVRVLPDGPVLRISQELGQGAKGCRLDPEALETAVGLAEARLAEGADILIINKFGKHEAEGRGFRTVIAEALAADIPVIVGVNSLNLEAFQAFVGEAVTRLEPTDAALLEWATACARPAAKVA